MKNNLSESSVKVGVIRRLELPKQWSPNRILFLILLVGVIFTNCYRNDLDVNVLTDPINSSWSIPLFTSEFRIQELNQITDFISIQEDGSIQLRYQQDSVIRNNASSYFDLLPDQGLNEEAIFLADSLLIKYFEVLTIEDVRLSSVKFFEGQLRYEFDDSMPIGTIVRFKIFNASRGEEKGIFDFEVTPASRSGTFDIAGFDLLFGPEDEQNDMGYSFTILSAPGLSPTDPVLFNWNFINVKGEKATGDFGQRLFELGEGLYDLDLEGLVNFDGTLQLNDPKIRLTIHNPIGVPFEFEPFVTALKDGEARDITFPKVKLDGATSPGIPEIRVFEFDQTNSDIVSLFNNIPDQLVISGNLWTNPDDDPGRENFANRFDDLLVHIELIVPLKFSATGVSFSQRLENINFWADAPGRIRDMSLLFENTNSFPFDVQFDFIFFDHDNIPLDTVQIELIQAAETDDNGKVTSPSTYSLEVDFSSDQVDQLRSSTQAELKVTIDTENQGQASIQIFDDYFFKTLVQLKANIDYSLPR